MPWMEDMADKPTPLPCPFCGELLTHKTHRTGLDTDIWEHPRSAGCPLSEVGIGDPISIFDVQSDIAAWNKRTTPPEARPAPAHELVGYMSQARCFVHKHEVTEVEAQLYGWVPVYTLPAAPAQEPEYCDPSTTVYNLVEMVMSDCGHSTNNQNLLNIEGNLE